MFQRDYLMRFIERLAQAIAALVAKRNAGAPAEAEEVADQACRDLLGVDAASLVRLPLGSVLELLGVGGPPSDEVKARALLLARLLKEHGATLASTDRPAEARKTWIRAFCLYDELEQRTAPLPDEHAEAMAWLAGQLDD